MVGSWLLIIVERRPQRSSRIPEVVACLLIERLQTPVIKDQKLDVTKSALQSGISPVAVGKRDWWLIRVCCA